MTAKQRSILVISILLFLVSELFPPWRYEYQYIESFRHKCPAGYSFISQPPAVKSYDEMLSLCMTSEVPSPEQISTHKDSYRLNWQRVILLLLSVGILLALSDKRVRLKLVLGRILSGLGIVILLLYIFVQQFLYY